MKRVALLCLFVSLIWPVLALTSSSFAKRDDAFEAFWRRFKFAVESGDKSAVASLSSFPIGMSYGIQSIKSKAELKRRYREVFNDQTDAALCFKAKGPVDDTANSKRFTVGCPDTAGNEVVIYEFELTKAGWKFVRLDNINE